MNKLCKQPILALSAALGGGIAILLRLWHLQTRNTRDGRMLLAQGHIAGILVMCITVIVLAAALWYVLGLPRKLERKCPFPGSVPAIVGVAAGVLGIAYSAATFLLESSDPLIKLTGTVGLIAAVCLAGAGYLRMRDYRPNVLLHSAGAVYLMLVLICQYRMWSAEPQLELYLYALLATTSLMIATYHRACFDGKMGNLRCYTFFRLASIYLCLAAIPGSEFWVLYLSAAIWSIADLCPYADFSKEGR